MITFAIPAALTIGALLSGGCALFQPHIRDLAFAGLDVRTPATASAWHDQDLGRLRLRFTTKRNLLKLASGNGGYLHASLCPFTDVPFVAMSSILYRGKDLLDYGQDASELAGDGPFEYEAFITYKNQLVGDGTGHGLNFVRYRKHRRTCASRFPRPPTSTWEVSIATSPSSGKKRWRRPWRCLSN